MRHDNTNNKKINHILLIDALLVSIADITHGTNPQIKAWHTIEIRIADILAMYKPMHNIIVLFLLKNGINPGFTHFYIVHAIRDKSSIYHHPGFIHFYNVSTDRHNKKRTDTLEKKR